MARRYFVTYNSSKEHWEVKLENAERASRVFDHKKKAVRYAKKRANDTGRNLEIFTRDGRHQATNTYGTTDKDNPNR